MRVEDVMTDDVRTMSHGAPHRKRAFPTGVW